MRTLILIILALGFWAYNDRDSFDQAAGEFADTVGVAVSELQAEFDALEQSGAFDDLLADSGDPGDGPVCIAAGRPDPNEYGYQSHQVDVGGYDYYDRSRSGSGSDLSQLRNRVEAARLEYLAIANSPYMANSAEATRLYEEFSSLDRQFRRALHGR